MSNTQKTAIVPDDMDDFFSSLLYPHEALANILEHTGDNPNTCAATSDVSVVYNALLAQTEKSLKDFAKKLEARIEVDVFLDPDAIGLASVLDVRVYPKE